MRFLIILMLSFGLILANIFNTNRANVWVEDGSFAKSFHINSWSSSVAVNGNLVKVNNLDVTRVNSSNIAVLLNSANSSYPAVNSALISSSLVGLSSASASLGEDMNASSIAISPDGGVFNKTVEVTINASFAEASKKVYVQINREPMVALFLPHNGKKSLTFYLAKDGNYTVKYGFSPTNLKVANFTLDLIDKKADSDGDGIPDSVEAELGFNPFDNTMQDINNNGWSDFDEFIRDNNLTDSDGDGWSDFDERLRGTNPYNGDICVDIDSRPFASSLYAVEYNITSNTITQGINRVSASNVEYNAFYDSLKVSLGEGLCSTNTTVYSNSLQAKKFPHMRFDASKAVVVRVVEVDNNKTKVYKKWLNSYKELTPKTFAKTQVFANLPNNMSALEYKNAYVAYLRANLVKNKSLTFDINSTINVSLLEAAIKSRDDSNISVALGSIDFNKNLKALQNTKRAFNIYNQNFNTLYSDIASYFANDALFTNALNKFNSVDVNESTENLLIELLQENISEDKKYILALFSIVPKSVADINQSTTNIYNLNSDSDSDGLSNKQEVLSMSFSNPLSSDSDNDGLEDSDDVCLLDSDNNCLNEDLIDRDIDGDGVFDTVDNCPNDYNPDQNSTLMNGVGDVCAQKGVVISLPHTNIDVLQGTSVDFEALTLSSINATNINWEINNTLFATATLTTKYSFNDVGIYQICALNKANFAQKSCVSINVLKAASKKVDFNIFARDIVEGSSTSKNYALVEVSLSEPAKYDFTLPFTTQDLTAKKGIDYTVVQGNLTFSKGDSRGFIKILIIGDNIEENNEVFKLIVANKEKNITIIDDDMSAILASVKIKEATFDSAKSIDKIVEPDSDRDFTIEFSLAQAPSSTVSFDYEVLVLANAKPGEYNSMVLPISGSVTFNAGESNKSILLFVYGDTINESDRVFAIRLTNPNGVKFYQDPSSVTNPNEYLYNVLLVDNDPMPTLSFENSSYSVREGNTTTIKVILSNNSYRPIEANITIVEANSTATKDIDYKLYSQKVLIPASNPDIPEINFEYSFKVATFKDNIGEGNESVILTISNVQNAQIAADKNSSTTINIFEYPIEQALTFSFDDGVNGSLAWIVWPQNNYQTNMILHPNVGTSPINFTYIGDKVLFTADASNSPDLERLVISDGKNLAIRLLDFNRTQQQVSKMVNLDDKLYLLVAEYAQSLNDTDKLKLYLLDSTLGLVEISILEDGTNGIGFLNSVVAVDNTKLFITTQDIISNASVLTVYDKISQTITDVVFGIDFELSAIGNKIYFKNAAQDEIGYVEADNLPTNNTYQILYSANELINQFIIKGNYLYVLLASGELREINLDTNSSYVVASNILHNIKLVANKLYFIDGDKLKAYNLQSQTQASELYTFVNNIEVLELFDIHGAITFKDGYNVLKSYSNGNVNSIENLTDGAVEIIGTDSNGNLIYKTFTATSSEIKKFDGTNSIQIGGTN